MPAATAAGGRGHGQQFADQRARARPCHAGDAHLPGRRNEAPRHSQELARAFFFRFAASALSLRKGRERGQTSARKCTSVPARGVLSEAVVDVHAALLAPDEAGVL